MDWRLLCLPGSLRDIARDQTGRRPLGRHAECLLRDRLRRHVARQAALLPRLSRLAATGEMIEFRQGFARLMKLVFLVGAASADRMAATLGRVTGSGAWAPSGTVARARQKRRPSMRIYEAIPWVRCCQLNLLRM